MMNAQNVFSDHGATSFTDPHVTIPEAARVLRTGGTLVFNIATPFIRSLWGGDDAPVGRELRRPYFGLSRTVFDDPDDPSVQWQLPYGEWIRLFRTTGFAIEDRIELRAGPDAETTYTGDAPPDRARDYPGEHIWKVRKA